MNANEIPASEWENKKYLKIEDAARLKGLSIYFVRNAVKAGQLPHIKSGRTVYLDMEKFDEVMESMIEGGGTPMAQATAAEKMKIKTPKLASIRETAERIGLSYSAVRSGVVNGTIPSVKIGNKRYVEINKYIEMLDKQAAESMAP